MRLLINVYILINARDMRVVSDLRRARVYIDEAPETNFDKRQEASVAPGAQQRLLNCLPHRYAFHRYGRIRWLKTRPRSAAARGLAIWRADAESMVAWHVISGRSGGARGEAAACTGVDGASKLGT